MNAYRETIHKDSTTDQIVHITVSIEEADIIATLLRNSADNLSEKAIRAGDYDIRIKKNYSKHAEHRYQMAAIITKSLAGINPLVRVLRNR